MEFGANTKVARNWVPTTWRRHGPGGSNAGDPREGAPPDAALRRPRCSIVDREAGAAWRRDPCRSPSLSSSSRSGVPPAAVHHDRLMAAGRVLAAGIGMSPGARERLRRFGPAPRSVRSSATCGPARRLIPSCAIGSLVALVVGLVDRLGTSRLRACWGTGIKAPIGKRLDWVALIRPMVCERRAPPGPVGGGLPTGHGCKISMRRQPQAQSTSCSRRVTADSSTRHRNGSRRP